MYRMGIYGGGEIGGRGLFMRRPLGRELSVGDILVHCWWHPEQVT